MEGEYFLKQLEVDQLKKEIEQLTFNYNKARRRCGDYNALVARLEKQIAEYKEIVCKIGNLEWKLNYLEKMTKLEESTINWLANRIVLLYEYGVPIEKKPYYFDILYWIKEARKYAEMETDREQK